MDADAEPTGIVLRRLLNSEYPYLFVSVVFIILHTGSRAGRTAAPTGASCVFFDFYHKLKIALNRVTYNIKATALYYAPLTLNFKMSGDMFNNCTNMITGNIKFIISLISVLLLVSCATNPPEDYTQQWKADRKIRHIKLDNGVSILYLQAGDEGQTVLLMYTIRTQPGYFEKLIPLLENTQAFWIRNTQSH